MRLYRPGGAGRAGFGRSRGGMSGARVLRTGASSGIGRALAVRMAQPGTALGLVARRRERLEELREELAGRDARVYLYDADVRDREAMQRVAEEFISAAGGVSVAIANAGVSYPDDLRRGDAEQAVELMATNLLGAINTLLPVIPHMIEAAAPKRIRLLKRNAASRDRKD